MKHIYGTYRMAYTNAGLKYSISYYLDHELADYKAAGIMSIEDMAIADHQYTLELAPWLKSLTRFFKASYNENYVSDENFEIVKSKMMNSHYATYFDSIVDAQERVRKNTNLKEVEEWKFQLTEADEELGTKDTFMTIA